MWDVTLINNKAAFISKIIELPGGDDLIKNWEFLTLQKQWSTSSSLKGWPNVIFVLNLQISCRTSYSRYKILVLFSQILLLLAIFSSPTFKFILTIFKNHNYVTSAETLSILLESQFVIEILSCNVVEQVTNLKTFSAITVRTKKLFFSRLAILLLISPAPPYHTQESYYICNKELSQLLLNKNGLSHSIYYTTTCTQRVPFISTGLLTGWTDRSAPLLMFS